MVTILAGLVGGFIATLVMTLFQVRLGGDNPPPTSIFWSKYIAGGEPTEYVPQGMALHFIYGTGGGVVFASLISVIGFLDVASLELAIFWGLGYGVLLFVGAVTFWMPRMLGLKPDSMMAGMFFLFHLIYGAVLGAWLGLGIL